MTDEQYAKCAAMAAESRAAQGLPPMIEDPATLARIATLLDLPDDAIPHPPSSPAPEEPAPLPPLAARGRAPSSSPPAA